MAKLNPDIYFLPIEIGTVLYQKTSVEIQMSLEGNIKAVNEHEEPWVVEDINVSKQILKLFNLKTQRIYKMYFKDKFSAKKEALFCRKGFHLFYKFSRNF